MQDASKRRRVTFSDHVQVREIPARTVQASEPKRAAVITVTEPEDNAQSYAGLKFLQPERHYGITDVMTHRYAGMQAGRIAKLPYLGPSYSETPGVIAKSLGDYQVLGAIAEECPVAYAVIQESFLDLNDELKQSRSVSQLAIPVGAFDWMTSAIKSVFDEVRASTSSRPTAERFAQVGDDWFYLRYINFGRAVSVMSNQPVVGATDTCSSFEIKEAELPALKRVFSNIKEDLGSPETDTAEKQVKTAKSTMSEAALKQWFHTRRATEGERIFQYEYAKRSRR